MNEQEQNQLSTQVAREADLPHIEDVLGDPAASFWLKDALHSALTRDPVDAANDAEVLARLLDRRCRKILANLEGIETDVQEE